LLQVLYDKVDETLVVETKETEQMGKEKQEPNCNC
jgi:hypothetical protein